MAERFGTKNGFLSKVNPATQQAFALNYEKAITGDYPTLNDIDAAYGKGFSVEWLIPQIDDMTSFTGAKNLDAGQQLGLARILATECRHLKVTEVLLFFHYFKAGRYGRFYGNVDPMVVTCALREYDNERITIIHRIEDEQRTERISKDAHSEDSMSRDEWLEIKTITAMYNSEYTVR